MKHISAYVFFLLLSPIVAISTLQAQEQKLNKADRDFERLDFVDAQQTYLKVAEKGYESEELFTRLANTYYFNAQYDRAARWFERLFQFVDKPANTQTYLRYSQSLRALGKDKEAKKYYDLFVQNNSSLENLWTVEHYLDLIEQNSGRYDLQPVEELFDPEKITFGHSVHDRSLIFASTETSGTPFKRISGWDGLSFLSLYKIALDTNYRPVGNAEKLKGRLNSKFHESSAIYTKDGKTMYFTRSNLTAKKSKNDEKLKIYRLRYLNGKWQEAEDLNINSDSYSTAHPALNPTQDALYFASDRPGGYGETDLYRAPILPDGQIGQPENLGPKINTPGKETFPFISESGKLYFSSDGHFGLGGLDVFYVEIKKEGFGNLLNVGRPINSSADDFSFGMDETTGYGFVSSNRSETVGTFIYDNIYGFVEKEAIKDVMAARIEGTVTDIINGKPLPHSLITLKTSDGKMLQRVETDSLGNYQFEIEKFVTYFVMAEKENYDTDEKTSIPGSASQQIDFQLQPNTAALTSGADLAKVLNIPIIYFDYDKATIRQDAQVELEKVLAVLEDHHFIKLKIRAHTDSRGSADYNLSLSKRRAQATAAYLIKNGVDKSRLQTQGVGESELVNHCSDGVECSEIQHQKNRRSEFLILE